MTIEELIQDLERIRDAHGPHIEVFKRSIKFGNGYTQFVPVKHVQVEDRDEDPTNWIVSL